MQSRRRAGKDLSITELPSKRLGCPLLLGEALEKELKAYLIELGKAGGVVNAEIAMASAKGLVKKTDSRLLAENGGHMFFTKGWAHHLLGRMGLVKSKVKISVNDFEERKEHFLCSISALVLMEEIPELFILNLDHTALKYVPVSCWTMAEQGVKKVSIAGIDDKRQITAVFTVTLDGQFLPVHLIYQGSTKACLPRVKFPTYWHVTSSPNHWANEITTKDCIENILNPYLIHKRAKLNLASNQHALCIFDNFKGQLTDEVLKLLEDSYIDIVFVPPNCTDMLQPLDLSVNKSAKDNLKSRFQQ